MARRLALLLAMIVGLSMVPTVADAGKASSAPKFTPGAAGIGDPYFPLDGNGGYDVAHYDLTISYDPVSDRLTGVAVITAMATQNLSQFNLDLDGLTVTSVVVNKESASSKRDGGELIVTPRQGLAAGRQFSVEVRYFGVPTPNPNIVDGFVATDDGAVVMGEPHVASTWYPVNDHPSDKALYDFHITVPKDLEAIANGALLSSPTTGGTRTWNWQTAEPMASYLTTATMGDFNLHSYVSKGISYVDAIDPDLFSAIPFSPTSSHLIKSQMADQSYKRLTRTLAVPNTGANLTFDVIRGTELDWDYVFVEARSIDERGVGAEDWTTLEDENQHTSSNVGFSCPAWHDIHPFLAHYQKANPDGTCSPTGTTGDWWAATGTVVGPETWQVDLDDYSGGQVEVSITYASDEFVQGTGVFIDNVVVSAGDGSTSFEDDGDVWDGWTVSGPPAPATNDNDWVRGTPDDLPVPGEVVQATFDRQPKIIQFLAKNFGPYPFTSAGGIVDDKLGLDSSLETQTRPIYAVEHFSSPESADIDVVHELSHQWFGDSLTIARWKHIWLNEGFATYAEWLWSEQQHIESAQEFADEMCALPGDDPVWAVTIGDPGADNLFDDSVYERGALTLHQLRVTIGDKKFFELLKAWAASRAGGLVATADFITQAKAISGTDLNAFFNTWLFTAVKPGPAWMSGCG